MSEHSSNSDAQSEDYEFTPTDDIINIQSKDLLVELIGYIKDTEGLISRSTGSVLSFVVSNKDKTTMKIVAWGKVAEKLHPKIQQNAIIQINGATAKDSNPQYNTTSRRNIQLNIHSNTEVKILGTFNPPNEPVPRISISNPGTIPNDDCHVTGYIKTNFAIMVSYNNPTNSSCFGAIAEDKTKLPIEIRNFPKQFTSPYSVGDHIELLGKFQSENNYMFIVANFDNITKIDDKTMARKKLSLANQQIPVPSSSTAHRQNKKRKLDNDAECSTSGCSKNGRKNKQSQSDSDEEDESSQLFTQ